MMKLKIIVLVGICLLAACKKRKYPEENVQLKKEDIYVTGYVDSEPFNLKIGTDGYYCYSSYKQTADSVYVFQGELKKYDCNPCPLSLKLELTDYRKRLPGSSIPVDSVFRMGSRNFIPGLAKTYAVRFVSFSNKAVSFLHWNMSNGFSSQDSIATCEFGQPGVQTVSLTVRTNGNCESMVINKIFIDNSGPFACQITSALLQNTTSQFNPGIVGGKPPFRYTWSFGDGATSNLVQPSHTYQWAGSYPVKLKIEDAENRVCESNYIHIAGNDNSSCAANMTLSSAGSNDRSFNGVKLQWTDKMNVALKSDNADQPPGSYFEIINSQEYAPNEKGEAGRLLTLRFNVLLSDGNRKVWLKSDNTAIAVTYK